MARVLLAAGIAGVAGDLLLRGGNWRAGFALWIAGLIAAVLTLGGRASTERLMLLSGIGLAAFGLVWRDAELLYVIDLLSLLCMGALLLWHGTGRSVSELTLVETVRAGVIAAINSIAGAVGAVTRGDSDPHAPGRGRTNVRALLLGVALAIVPLLLVGRLLAASDLVFEGMMQRLLDTVFSDGLSHLFIIVLLAWVVTGWLRAALGDPIGRAVPQPHSPGLVFVSVAVGLYALLALLLLFVGTQARVLFGGAAFLRETAGLSVANYAREGFFQLIVASGVVLVTLVVAEWLLAADDVKGRRHYRMVSAVLLVLVAALLVSSATRIWLYVSEFGLSVDRAFASAAIVWVLGVLVAFAATTLRASAALFMPAAIVVTAAWVATMNVINPEAIVVRVNVARAEAGHSFDAAYHAHLSGDALPTLLDQAPRLGAASCAAVDTELRTWWSKRLADPTDGGSDWRSVNVPLRRAREWFGEAGSVCL